MNKSIENDPLWSRIRDMDIDGADHALSFSRRLARDNGWQQEHANQVVFEYKRFIYLAATQGESVTPSDEVDQAWHLHLAYSRHYWEMLCDEILGKALHHGPTEGGGLEQRKFEARYSRTLELYEKVFGKWPRSDIWPSPTERFRDVEAFRRVNSARNFILDKNTYSVIFLVIGTVIIVSTWFMKDTKALSMLVGGSIFAIPIFMAFKSTRKDKKRKDEYERTDPGSGGGCGGCGG